MNSPVEKFYRELQILQQQPKEINGKRKGRPRSRMYFTEITEKAICAYNIETNDTLRNKIWNEHIHYAINKLAENIINRFKFVYMDGSHSDVKSEVVSFILQKLPKYTQDKGKAFSYFSIVAKNYLIQNNNKNYKRLTKKAAVNHIDWQRNVTNEIVKESVLSTIKDFMNQFVERYTNQVEDRFRMDRDKAIAYAVLELFRTRENIETYNKKALYILIREMTGAKTQYITKVVKQIKKEYEKHYEIYKHL